MEDSDYFSLTQERRTLPGRAGTIMKIVMKNFMCHEHMEVNLNPRINFIVGKNGSGKSAIQTAIAVGLGGRAVSTNRGSSIKALIKNDKNTAHILIVLSNEGPMAYKPESYGDFIKVERTFSQTSTQGYKLKNANGKLVSNEKKELDKIVDHLNIQVDNPMCILHQDVARNFLNTSDPKMLFKFFMKASRFDDISKLYEDSTSKIATISRNINNKFEVVQEVFKDVIEMKKKLKTLEEAKEKEKVKEKLENELIWANIRDINGDLERKKTKRGDEFNLKKRDEDQLKEIEETDLKEQMRELELKLVEKENQVKDAREKVKPAREMYLKMREQHVNTDSQLRDAKSSIKKSTLRYNRAIEEIENLTKTAPEKKQQQENYKQELIQCQSNLKEIRAAEDSLERDNQLLHDTVEKISRDLKAISNQFSEVQRQINTKKDQIRQLAKSSNNLTVYGDAMVKFVDAINKAFDQGKFQKKPVGPIGIHIKVKESSWAGAVEGFLGKTLLRTFCVDNIKDKETLISIRNSIFSRRNEPQPAIIHSRFLSKIHNTSSNETGTAKYKSLQRMMEINNPVVANCLIDQQEVETVLLIPTNNEAYQLLDKQDKVPRMCKRAFTKTGDQFYPAPNYKSYASARPVTHATLLQVAQEDLIRELKNEVDKLTHDKDVVENDVKHFQQQEKDTRRNIAKNDEERRKLKRTIIEQEQKLINLKDNLSELEQGSNVAYFVDESKELKRQLDNERAKFNSLEEQMNELQEKEKEAKNIFEGLQKTIAESDREKVPIQEKIMQLNSTIQQASTKGDVLRQRLNEREKKIAQLDKEIAELIGIKTENTENATQLCPPIETSRSTNEITREIKGIELYLKKVEEENGGSLEELQRTFDERHVTFETVKKDLNTVRFIVKKAQSALKTRKRKEQLLKVFLSNAAKHNFMAFLAERNFDGKLEFDLDAGLLSIKVKPFHDKSDVSTQKLDIASLSGGEKSFSTVSFVMALWQEVDLPFHFLDEFDVFMDGVNRRTVMDLLLNYASERNQQYVFLTPLDTSSIKSTDNISIYRLESPRE